MNNHLSISDRTVEVHNEHGETLRHFRALSRHDLIMITDKLCEEEGIQKVGNILKLRVQTMNEVEEIINP